MSNLIKKVMGTVRRNQKSNNERKFMKCASWDEMTFEEIMCLL